MKGLACQWHHPGKVGLGGGGGGKKDIVILFFVVPWVGFQKGFALSVWGGGGCITSQCQMEASFPALSTLHKKNYPRAVCQRCGNFGALVSSFLEIAAEFSAGDSTPSMQVKYLCCFLGVLL